MFYIYSVILSTIALLVVIATIYEYFRIAINDPIDPKKDSFDIRVLHCFSLVNNCKKLLSTASPSGNLGCVNGIRVLSTTWVVMGHSYFILVTYGHQFGYGNPTKVSKRFATLEKPQELSINQMILHRTF